MNRRRFCTLAISSASLALRGASVEPDWPQWQGPDRTGLSKETGLLKSWPKDGPSVHWKIDTLGAGYSAPAVVGDTLYLLGSDDRTEYLFALDAATGKKRYQTPLGDLYDNPWG